MLRYVGLPGLFLAVLYTCSFPLTNTFCYYYLFSFIPPVTFRGHTRVNDFISLDIYAPDSLQLSSDGFVGVFIECFFIYIYTHLCLYYSSSMC